MQKLYLMCGYSFSGKTYLTKLLSDKTNAKTISLDKINEERGLDSNTQIPVSEWENTHKIALERLNEYLIQGNSVIIDDTNPLLKLRDRFRKVGIQNNVETVVIYIDIPEKEIERRIEEAKNKKDRHLAPDEARKSLISMFEMPDPNVEKVYVYHFGDDFNNWVKEIVR